MISDAEALGLVAGFLIALGLVPQILRVWRLKDAQEISLTFNLLSLAGTALWLVYGVILGLFLVAFFLPKVRGTAVFWAGIVAEAIVLALFFRTGIGYLWFNPIGCLVCVGLAWLLDACL